MPNEHVHESSLNARESVPATQVGPSAPPSMLQAVAGHVGVGVIQRKLARRLAQRKAQTGEVAETGMLEAAEYGIQGNAQSLPYKEKIQASFGQHDVGAVQAFVGDKAAEASRYMGAEAYATGNTVAFASSPDLHTAAHEAAHVVQQRAGVQLKGGVGEAGDSYERHADSVADRVVQGQSAEALLGENANGAAHAGPVQKQASREAQASGAKEVWSKGPTSQIKSKGHTLAEYLAWLREAEAAYGGNKEAFVQRLRRLYYSNFTGGAGPKFDSVIDTQNAGDAPMTSPPLTLSALNGLFETNYLTTPAGTQIDVSHVLAALDLSVAGTNFKAGAAEILKGVDFRGVLTWSGDLASWFVEFQDQLRKTEHKQQVCLGPEAQTALLLSLAERKVAKDDLIGDMDGQAMVERGTQIDVIPSYGEGPPAIITSMKDTVSGMLEAYYGDGQRGSSKTNGSQEPNRFANFLNAARPDLPHSSSAGKVQLGSGAKQAMYDAIKNAAALFIDQGIYAGTPDAVKRYDNILWQVTFYFEQFLRTGLERGDAQWPPR